MEEVESVTHKACIEKEFPLLFAHRAQISLVVHISVLVTSRIITTETSVLQQMLACSTTGHVTEERKLVQRDKALSHESSLRLACRGSCTGGEKYKRSYLQKQKAQPIPY